MKPTIVRTAMIKNMIADLPTVKRGNHHVDQHRHDGSANARHESTALWHGCVFFRAFGGEVFTFHNGSYQVW